MMSGHGTTATKRRHTKVAIACVAFVTMMVGVAYAAVPLYRIFCQVTGYGGTTQVADAASGMVLDRRIKVRFDANVARDLSWGFKPVQREIDLKIGENALAFYRADNGADVAVTGTATFNVTPLEAGQYFNKIECFCFTEQTLKPGESVDMPVSFYVDPEIDRDPNLAHVRTITLSYTFFPVDKRADAGKASGTMMKN